LFSLLFSCAAKLLQLNHVPHSANLVSYTVRSIVKTVSLYQGYTASVGCNSRKLYYEATAKVLAVLRDCERVKSEPLDTQSMPASQSVSVPPPPPAQDNTVRANITIAGAVAVVTIDYDRSDRSQRSGPGP
jgi:hypothetical protein